MTSTVAQTRAQRALITTISRRCGKVHVASLDLGFQVGIAVELADGRISVGT